MYFKTFQPVGVRQSYFVKTINKGVYRAFVVVLFDLQEYTEKLRSLHLGGTILDTQRPALGQ